MPIQISTWALRWNKVGALERDLSQIFKLIVSTSQEILNNKNVVWRQVKKENSSLPVAACVTKTSRAQAPLLRTAFFTNFRSKSSRKE